MKGWNRLLWGVVTDEKSYLLGSAWHQVEKAGHPGEPTRALLFVTRRAAREWCRQQMEKTQANPATAHWRFVPVRVRERVEESKR